MPVDLRRKLSPSFTLGELLASATAEREPSLKARQHAPPDEVVDALAYLCTNTLQPLRDTLGFPIEITSGYRCQELNRRVDGAPSSQHVLGEAADCRLSPRFLSDPATEGIRRQIEMEVEQRTGARVRPDVNANFYLFARAAMSLDGLDVDQVIHEHGEGPGEPAWVHISASERQNRRQIKVIGPYARAEDRSPDLSGALRMGTQEAELVALAEGGSMQQDPGNPARFNVTNGTGVAVDVTAVRTGVFAAASPPAMEIEPGRFTLVVTGDPGDRELVVVAFQFMEPHDPPASYEVEVSSGTARFDAPTVFQPIRGDFPQTVDYVLTFVVMA